MRFVHAILLYMCEFDLDAPDPTVENAMGRLRLALASPNLREAVRLFYDPNSSFAGHSFDSLGRNPPNRITSDDLLAVTLLDVGWTPPAARALLGELAEKVTELLRTIDDSTALWDDRGCQELINANRLWKVIGRLPGVGTTRTSKLLARKRPLLVPITDSIVVSAVDNRGKTWLTLRYCFQQEPFRQAVESLRPPQQAEDVSLLRIFDVAIWMLCSRSRDARKARERTGVPQDSCTRGRPEVG
jgi:Family of unknown function (DUF6308)